MCSSIAGHLYVIVEYCCNGSLRKYLLEHRESFMDCMTSVMDQIPRDSVRNDSGGGSSIEKKINYSDIQHSPRPGNEYLALKDIEAGHVDDVTAATYVAGTEYVNLPQLRKGIHVGDDFPLTTKDLVCYAYQIARGMEYLSAKKVWISDLTSHGFGSVPVMLLYSHCSSCVFVFLSADSISTGIWQLGMSC